MAKKRIQYSFDSAGNRSAMVDPDGGRFTYAYDSLNRIAHLENPQNERTSYQYDAAGRRTLKRLANGTRASFSYDVASNLTRLANLKSDGTTISSFDYQYDRSSNRTAVLENDGSRVTWSYDATYQLTGEHRTGSHPYRNTFTYDAAGNRTLKNEDTARTTYAYDAANQLTTSQDSLGTTTYTFDADGNQQIVEPPTGDRTTTTWDYENRTTLVELSSGLRNTMAYEPDGLRIKLEDSTGTKKFIWDDQNYLTETDASDVTQVVYTNEPAYYGNLVSQRRDSTTNWYHFDAIGSSRDLTLASDGVSDTYLYDAWGNIVAITGTTINAFQFAGALGYCFDIDTQSNYVRERFYASHFARWLSFDPLDWSFSSGTSILSLFAYAANSPVDCRDPSGTIVVEGKRGQKGRCPPGNPSESFRSWAFALEENAPCNGFIVQKVSVKCEKMDCLGDNLETDSFEYWEAWPIEIGRRTSKVKKRVGSPNADPENDRASYHLEGCMVADIRQDGDIRFYCNTDMGLRADYTGNSIPLPGWDAYGGRRRVYGQENDVCPTSPWQLTSTGNEPSFWKKGESATARNRGITPGARFLEVGYICCPASCMCPPQVERRTNWNP